MGPDQYWDWGYNQFVLINNENRRQLRENDQLGYPHCCGTPFNKSPFVRVTLERNIVSALWDSGSDLSLISADKVKEDMELTPLELDGTPQAVEGSKIEFKGKLTLNVCIGNT